MKAVNLIFIMILTSCANTYIPTSNQAQDEVVVCKDYGPVLDCIVSDKQSARYEIERVLNLSLIHI